jgi:hypothetical protein
LTQNATLQQLLLIIAAGWMACLLPTLYLVLISCP